MADDKGKGSAPTGLGGLTFIIVLMVLFSVWLNNNGANNFSSKSGVATGSQSSRQRQTTPVNGNSRTTQTNNSSNSTTNKDTDKKYSPYYKQISISSSAVGPDNPNQEFITLSARNNKEPIEIGGWTLKNGRDKKTYIVSGQAVKGQSVSVKIPDRGVILYNPYKPNTNIHSPIKLKAGEKAVIVTGQVPAIGSVTINENFKINRCLGYVQDRPVGDRYSYNFSPTLRYNCPTSRDLPDISNLDDTCYNFVRSISGCHQPTDIYDKANGYCLDRNCKLSSFCRNFVKQNFNPQACFELYSTTKNFIGPEWRIYLNRNWELWEKQRETISLYDRAGLLVAEISY